MPISFGTVRSASEPVGGTTVSRLVSGTTAAVIVVVVVATVMGSHARRPTARSRATRARPAAPLAPRRGALLGSFVSADGTGWSPAVVTAREAMIGRRYDIDHRFQNWTTPFPTPADRWDIEAGRVPMISWQPDATTLDAINAGAADAVIRGRARAVAAFGRPMFLRFAHEMNANWYPWDGTHASTPGTHDGPSKYIAAWRHVHDVFVTTGATNVVWVWSPNRTSIPDVAWNAASAYYPGDDYVDWVGIDGYQRDPVHDRSFTTLFAPLYDEYASRKPIMIAETSSVEGRVPGRKAAWIDATRSDIEHRFPAIAALVWFDTAKNGFDWHVDSSTAAERSFRALANDPYFRTRPEPTGSTLGRWT